MEEKGTRRYPVTTLVLYFGEKSWKAPRTVAEAVDWEAIPYREQIRPLVSNPHLNVVEIRRLPKEVRRQFQSDFRVVAEWLRPDAEKAREELQDWSYHICHVEALLDFLAVFSGEEAWENAEIRQKILAQDKAGGVPMRTMWDVLREDKEKSVQEGKKEGIQEGVQKEQRRIVRFMARSEKDPEKIAQSVGIPVERVRELMIPLEEDPEAPEDNTEK